MSLELGEPRAVLRGRMKSNRQKIIELRTEGYSFAQIAKWLSNNGIKVTPDGVRKFLLREESK